MKTHFSTENSLVFVVVCSLVCFGSTKKDESEGVSRTYVTEGEAAILHCSYRESLENTVIDWKNKDKEVFLYSYGLHYENGRSGQDDQYKGRVSLFYDELKNGNASMILRNTRIEDTGIYSCVLPHLSSGWKMSKMELIVGVSRTYVTEGEEAVLHCSSGGNLENTVVNWKNKDNKEVFFYESGQHYENGRSGQDDQYKGRVSLFYDELKNGNASMILRNTRIEDTGIYTCELPLLSPGRKRMELIVGAVHAPYVGISDVTEAGVELQCEVKGSSSKPSVEWETCEGISLKATNQRVSETQGRYDTKLFITVTEMKTNCFSCVVKQEDIYHRVHSEIILSKKLFEIKSSHSSGELVGIWFSGVVTVLSLLLLALVLYQIIRRCRYQNTGDGGNNVMNGPEEFNLVSTNQTSGETNLKVEIPQTDSDYDERSSLQNSYDSA